RVPVSFIRAALKFGSGFAANPVDSGNGPLALFARALDEARGAAVGQRFHDHHFAAGGFDDLAADDLVPGVIATFYEHLWAHAADEFQRRVLVENDDEIDGLQCGEELCAGALILDRAALALETLG